MLVRRQNADATETTRKTSIILLKQSVAPYYEALNASTLPTLILWVPPLWLLHLFFHISQVYLHDVEYVCEAIQPRVSGNPVLALGEDKKAYGLAEGYEAIVHGTGDQILLDAIAELRRLKSEGLIRNIGITGAHTSHIPQVCTFLKVQIQVIPFQPFFALRCSSCTQRLSSLLTFYSLIHISACKIPLSSPSQRSFTNVLASSSCSLPLRSAWAS